MFCPACGTEQPDAAQFCFKCGKRMPAVDVASLPAEPPAPVAARPSGAAQLRASSTLPLSRGVIGAIAALPVVAILLAIIDAF